MRVGVVPSSRRPGTASPAAGGGAPEKGRCSWPSGRLPATRSPPGWHSQHALLHIQRADLKTVPHEEPDELAHIYMQRGLSLGLASQVAAELTARDALAAHAQAELGIDLADQVNAWEAAGASALSFLLGGVLSLLAIMVPPPGVRIEVCVAVVLASLPGTGYLAARFGAAPTGRAAARNLTVGSLTMAVTYALGPSLRRCSSAEVAGAAAAHTRATGGASHGAGGEELPGGVAGEGAAELLAQLRPGKEPGGHRQRVDRSSPSSARTTARRMRSSLLAVLRGVATDGAGQDHRA